MAAPTYSIHHDLVEDTVTCELANTDEIGLNKSRYTVSNLNPAVSVIDSSCRYRPPSNKNMKIDATCRTTSDATHYVHISRVEIHVDGKLYFDKTWNETVARNWS
jgi:hypothetical protein